MNQMMKSRHSHVTSRTGKRRRRRTRTRTAHEIRIVSMTRTLSAAVHVTPSEILCCTGPPVYPCGLRAPRIGVGRCLLQLSGCVKPYQLLGQGSAGHPTASTGHGQDLTLEQAPRDTAPMSLLAGIVLLYKNLSGLGDVEFPSALIWCTVG